MPSKSNRWHVDRCWEVCRVHVVSFLTLSSTSWNAPGNDSPLETSGDIVRRWLRPCSCSFVSASSGPSSLSAIVRTGGSTKITKSSSHSLANVWHIYPPYPAWVGFWNVDYKLGRMTHMFIWERSGFEVMIQSSPKSSIKGKLKWTT